MAAAIPVASADEYLKRMLSLPRRGGEELLAYYEHRIGLIGKDPRLMLLPLDDHLAHRGDGVFETLKYTEGRLYLLDAHLERLQRSAAGIFLTPPCSWESIRDAVIQVASAGGEKAGQIRVIIGRGLGGFSVDPSECPEASLYIAACRFRKKPDRWFEDGVKGCRTSIPAKQAYIAGLKTTNYVPNALMYREAKERGGDISFCFDQNNCLAESAVSNICLVDKSGTLAVPEFTHALRGTTLLRAMELIRGEIPVSVRPIPEAEIFSAKEAILLGTGFDCVAIVSYEGKAIGNGKPGPVSTRLRALISEDILKTGLPVPGLA